MKKDSLVILKTTEPLILETDTLRPNKFYRCIELTENGKTEMLVYGCVFDKETFDKNFELAYERVLRDWETIGLLVGGKKLSYKAFKEKASVHQYVQYRRQRSKLNVIYFYIHPKDCMYGFYPCYGDTKERCLKLAYARYLDVLNGEMSDIDSGLVQFGNGGIPLSYGDLRVT